MARQTASRLSKVVPTRTLFSAAALAAALLLVSCGLLEKVTSNKLLVVTWFKMPKFEQEPFASLPGLGTTTVSAIFMDAAKQPPAPVQGGFAAFFGAGKKIDLVESSVPGVYARSSADDAALVYDDSPTKRFGLKACLIYRNGCIGQEFTISRIRGAPELDRTTLQLDPAPAVSPLPGFDGRISAGQAITLRFPAPSADAVYRPVVMVFGPTGNAAKPVDQIFSTMPSKPEKYFDFLNSEPKFEITIPGEVFSAEGPYAVLAAGARVSMETKGLFAASGAIAGAATGFLLEVPVAALASPPGREPEVTESAE